MKALELGSRRELMVDDFLIERLDGTQLRLHPPQLLPLADSPFANAAYATIIKDGDLFRAYYRSRREDRPEAGGEDGSAAEITCYAESRDGSAWTKPSLGLFEIRGSRHNSVILAEPPFCHNFSPFLDRRPGVPEDERYKALAGVHFVPPHGLCAFVSADGIRWRKWREAPVITSEAVAFDSQNVAFWSECEQCYVAYYRSWIDAGWLRSISRITSPDFLHWSAPTALNPNEPGEHLYTSQTHPYFRAPHIYIATPTRLADDRGCTTDILFMTARGNAPYARPFKEAWIRPGLDLQRWGNRSNYAALNVVPTGPEEMSVYHSCSGHRYALRTDGFASVNAGHGGGEMLTKPFLFSGTRLSINFSTAAGGSMQVEIQGADGAPLPGYALADCPAFWGDAIEHQVCWQGGADVGALAGRPVRLRFVMKEADLFALRFGDNL